MQRDLTIGRRTVRFQCAKELVPQADWLQGLLKDIAAERGDDFFAPGKTIQLGWSRLTLVEDAAGVLDLHEPDFDANPATQTRNDLTVTLTVIAQQNDFTALLGLEPTPVDFLDKVVCVTGALQAADVFLQRQTPKPGDSGWTLKLLDDPHRDGDYEWVFVHVLLRLLPKAMGVLTLPVDYMAMMPDRELAAILDDKDNQVYTRKE